MNADHVRALRTRRDITVAQERTLLSLVERGVVDPCREECTPAQCKLWYTHHPSNKGLGGHIANVRDMVLKRGNVNVHRKIAEALHTCGHMMPLNTYLGEWYMATGGDPVVLEAVAWIWLDACGAMSDVETFQEYHGQAVTVEEASADPVKLLRVLSGFKRAHDMRGFRPSKVVDGLALKNGWWGENSTARCDALVYAHVDETMGEHEWIEARDDTDLEVADRVSSLARVGERGITFSHIWHLSRSVHTLLTTAREESLDPIAHESLETLTDEQNAVRTAVLDGTHPVTLCCSPAGTGKTHTASAIVDSHEWPMGVICVAPTHKALSVLRTKITTRVTFTTVQKLAVTVKVVPASLVIVDETSMLTMRHVRVILDTYPDARILLLGDDAQLPCIGRGLPIKDLQRVLPTHRLTRCMRTEGAELIALAARVRDGFAVVRDHVGVTGEVVTLNEASVPAKELSERAAARVVSSSPPWESDYVQLIACENKHVDMINRSVQARLTGTGPTVSGCYEGDAVRMQYNTIHYKNGDEGTVVTVREKRGQGDNVKTIATVMRRDGSSFTVDRDGHMKPAYASTVHKCQGSEYATIVLALFRETYLKMVTREMVYTSVTRARHALSIIGHLPWLDALESEERRTVFSSLHRL